MLILLLIIALLETALKLSKHQVPVRIVYQRPHQIRAEMREGDFDYDEEMKKVELSGKSVKECVPVWSHDPLYIHYTSGTTGQPKVSSEIMPRWSQS